MNTPTNDTNMTGNADNRSELRTNCGQPIPRDKPWHLYPNGTKAPAHGGGHWVRVTGGWKWCTGDIFPTPGGDNMDQVILPDQPAPPLVQLDKDGIVRPWPWDGSPGLPVWNGPGKPMSVMPIPDDSVMKSTPRPGSGFSDPQVPPPPMPRERPTPSEELEIRTCFMGPEFGEIEAVPLFRYRALQRELAEARKQVDGAKHCLTAIQEAIKQRDTLAEALESELAATQRQLKDMLSFLKLNSHYWKEYRPTVSFLEASQERVAKALAAVKGGGDA